MITSKVSIYKKDTQFIHFFKIIFKVKSGSLEKSGIKHADLIISQEYKELF